MLDEKTKNEILKNIALTGDVTTQINPIIGGNLHAILNLSSGAPRLQTNVTSRFRLILSQPSEISVLNPFEIRCALCKRVISYPAWYYSIKYSWNNRFKL